MDSEEAECSRDHETVKRQANECGHDREVKQEALFEVMKNDEGVSAEEAKTKRAVGTKGVNKNKFERHS
ncbi:hypothetical protein WN944_025799 [Citrus x changshan-huyou]|uniref:Uncharacterized protein n=1 Tax=Citrus x changshan-huyou TaxID=2935761 RepID=A0AAP0LT77_9ROSI